MSALGSLLPTCTDTQSPSHDCGPFSMFGAMASPSGSGCLCSHPRTSRRHLFFSETRNSRLNEAAKARRLPGRSVSVTCSQGSMSSNGPQDEEVSSPKLHSRDGGANCGDDNLSKQMGLQFHWDFEAQQKQWGAAITRMGDPIWEIFNNVGRALQSLMDSNVVSQTEVDKCEEMMGGLSAQPNCEREWDWERWKEHFTEVEQQENLASVLKFELEDAIDAEDFQEAARLKSALTVANASDSLSGVLTALEKALEEERYEEAARLRDEAGAGLVGWWVGLAEGENDPYGRIVNISPAHGRYVARGFTARQLISASPGAPLFEIFIQKESGDGYRQQPVYLQRDGGMGDAMAGAGKPLDVNINVNIVEMNSLSESGKEVKAKEGFSEEKGRSGDATLTDEGLSRIINFLKERMPDVKLKVFRVVTPNSEDLPKIVEQILEDVTEASKDATRSNEDTGAVEDGIMEVKESGSASSGSAQESQKEIPVRVIVGGMPQSGSEEKLPKAPTRLPARIEYRSRDVFIFHVEKTAQQMSLREVSLPLKVATISPQALEESATSDAKVSKDMGEALKIAVSQVQRRRGLSKCTAFKRINLMDSKNDPLTGLFVGAFGPYTSELVQLRRKYGCWDGESDTNKGKLEFFEYVEAVKLTGDLNVPAGQVTFRAKIGRENRLLHRGVYLEELGVTARYKGQGRLAEPGFKNPHWVDGELIVLDGKGIGHTNGAELGFVYSVPERHFLVLFNRLKLQI